MKKPFKTALCTTLILSTVLAGCGADPGESRSQTDPDQRQESSDQGREHTEIPPLEITAENLSARVVRHDAASAVTVSPSDTVAATDFGLRLFQQSMQEGENTLISPLSVLCALSMTANGADGGTLAQMEELFGMSRDELNEYLFAYVTALPQGDKYKLSLANSIWLRDVETLEVQDDFLQTNVDWHNAEIYRAPFDDSTLQDINSWVNANTDGMIPEILNQISPDAVLYLINALAFDAEWDTIYQDTQVQNRVFTTADGEEQNMEMMYSNESKYLEDDQATGFIKYYADRKYAFVALLPKEGTSLANYAASLTGETLAKLLAEPQTAIVWAGIPKFQCEYTVELNRILQTMGMADAFDDTAADFTSMASCADGPLFISRVLHKTYIAVDERGTRAGAVTAVEMNAGGTLQEIKTVYLDRPFLYMLIDCDTNLPVFIGTLENLEQ